MKKIFVFILSVFIFSSIVSAIQLSPDRVQLRSKTGMEQYIDVDISMYNNTVAIVTLSFNNETEFKNQAKDKKYNLRKYPIEILNGSENLRLLNVGHEPNNKFSLYLETNSTFYIEFNGSFRVKLGWESIELDGTTGTTIPIQNTFNRHLLYDEDNNCHIIFQHYGDVVYYNSTDGRCINIGPQTNIADANGATYIEMGYDLNNNIIVHYLKTNDIYRLNSTDNGKSWSSAALVVDTSACSSFDTDIDSNGIWHYTLIDTSDYAYYANDTTPTDEVIVIHQDATDDSQNCGITILDNDCILTVCNGEQEDFDIWGTCGAHKGFGTDNGKEIYDNTFNSDPATFDFISDVNDNCYLAGKNLSSGKVNIWRSADNSNCYNWSLFYSTDTHASYPTLSISRDGGMFLLVESSSDTHMYNDSDGVLDGSFMENDDMDSGAAGNDFVAMPYQRRPELGLPTNRIDWLGDDVGGDVNYANWTIPYLIQPIISFEDPTQTNNTIITDQYVEINVSLTDQYLQTLTYNWNGTNYTIYDDSLVLLMNFNNVTALGEHNTRFVDISNTGTYGTGENFEGIEIVKGKYQKGVYFDGDDCIDTGDFTGLDGTTSFTMMAWINYTTLTTNDAIMRKWDVGEQAYTWGLDNGFSDELEFYVEATDGKMFGFRSTNANLVAGNWYHLVVVWDGGNTGRFYVDGIQKTSTNEIVQTPVAVKNIAENMCIGCRCNGGAYDLETTGTIDEPMIFDYALTEEEIQQYYMTNLYKYNQTSWILYINQTQNVSTLLNNGTYTYQAFASDVSQLYNQTDKRFITINTDYTPPVIGANCTAYGGSGDYVIDCTENCQIHSDTTYDLTGSDLIFTGDGTVNIWGKILNVADRSAHNNCKVRCYNDCLG